VGGSNAAEALCVPKAPAARFGVDVRTRNESLRKQDSGRHLEFGNGHGQDPDGARFLRFAEKQSGQTADHFGAVHQIGNGKLVAQPEALFSKLENAGVSQGILRRKPLSFFELGTTPKLRHTDNALRFSAAAKLQPRHFRVSVAAHHCGREPHHAQTQVVFDQSSFIAKGEGQVLLDRDRAQELRQGHFLAAPMVRVRQTLLQEMVSGLLCTRRFGQSCPVPNFR